MKVVIAIATAGRPAQMSLTLEQVAKQTAKVDLVVVCPANERDFEPAAVGHLGLPIEVVHGTPGLCPQRNAVIEHCRDADLLVFFDDDFYPAPDYLAQVTRLFREHRDVVVATNHPVFDGASGPGIPHDQAVRITDNMTSDPAAALDVSPTYGGYGCNMVVRAEPVMRHQVRFDERLPLYGWLEDIDFTRRLAPYGRIVKCRQLQGVHLGIKRGRLKGVRLGYSQLANPYYMVRKGSVAPSFAAKYALRNVAMNGLRCINPEPWVDRRGRLWGNTLALFDFVRGRLRPDAILEM